MGNGALAIGPKLPRPSSTLPDPPSALPRQPRQVSEGKLTRQAPPRRWSRQPNLTPKRLSLMGTHCDAQSDEVCAEKW